MCTAVVTYYKKAVHAVTACEGSKGIAPLILILGARWRREVKFTHRPF